MPIHKQAVVRNSSRAIGLPSKVKMDTVGHTICKHNGLTKTPNEIQTHPQNLSQAYRNSNQTINLLGIVFKS
jgi:hypothetical protein